MPYRGSQEFLRSSIAHHATALVVLLLTSTVPSAASTPDPPVVEAAAPRCGLELGPWTMLRGPLDVRESWRSVVGGLSNPTTDTDRRALEQLILPRHRSTKEEFHEVDPDPSTTLLATPLLATLTLEVDRTTVHLVVGPRPQGCDVEEMARRPAGPASKEEFHEVDPDPSTIEGPVGDLWDAWITWSTPDASRLQLQVGFTAPVEGWNRGRTDGVWQALFERLGELGRLRGVAESWTEASN